ncbi:kinesin-domain-containing protein [Lichtheimia hyalospora FSU 10163]|nr:kinesin-domain-containing protein [Lichtheimia hyalospora FSU 10163]
MNMATTAVRVAVRVRPLTKKEILSNATETISFIPDVPQIIVGKDHTFTYDHVFDTQTQQQHIYETSVLPLTEKFVDGFNATILAYGQTGSGKTYSMGTAIDGNTDSSEQQGIVPRFIRDLFDRLENKKNNDPEYESQVLVSFLELYNEDLVDLLNFQQRQRACDISIRQDVQGNIYWSGVREEPCSDPRELLGYLTKGSLGRTVGSTDMNAVSSRSHAIFSVILKQQLPDEDNADQRKTIVSKFHFVDLAGSERLVRTNAQGVRAREGIAINSGLLALGNVISALGDESRRSTHIPYRDSKLTRLLQDSLGGNSQTLMVACVSPANNNLQETLSTLKYANRARNIKNRVSVNQEYSGSSVEVNQMRAQLAKLKMELAMLRSGNSNVSSGVDHTKEIEALRNEVNRLRARVQETSDELCQVSAHRDSLLLERQMPSDMYNQMMQQGESDNNNHTLPIIAEYQKTIHDLRNELEDTRSRLSFMESTQQQQQPKVISATPTPSINRSSRSRTTRRRRTKAGVTFKSSRSNSTRTRSKSRPKSPPPPLPTTAAGALPPRAVSRIDDRDIDQWLQETIGPISATNSADIRNEVRDSITKARMEIEKGLKVLDGAKSKEQEQQQVSPFDGDLLADDEMLEALQSKENEFLFSHLEDEPGEEDIQRTTPPADWDALSDTHSNHLVDDGYMGGGGHSRFSSGAITGFTEDSEFVDLCQDNPQFARVLQQIQSDIHVKEELVSQLERCESEYVHMRRKFEQRLNKLGHEILTIKRERDDAMRRAQIQSQHQATSIQQHAAAKDNTQIQREKQQLSELRHGYEQKIRSLSMELSETRRKFMQVSNEIQSSRKQTQSIKKALSANIESSKIEKRRMVQRMKEEAMRTKEQMTAHEREIQKLRRRQQRDAEDKRRLERENKRVQVLLQNQSQEVVVTKDKLKRSVQVLKKAMREGGVLDDRLLKRCADLLHMGALITNRHSTRQRQPKQHKRRIPVETRAAKKKDLLDRALFQYIHGRQSIAEMQQLIAKHNELFQKREELQTEREHLFGGTDNDGMIQFDQAMMTYMDERIEAIGAEISYISARIQALQNETTMDNEEEIVDMDMQKQQQQRKHVTFADEVMGTMRRKEEDEWLDMDALEERYSIPDNADPETSHRMALKVIHSLTPEEAAKVMESMINDLTTLRMDELSREVQIQQMEKSIQDLQNTLTLMKDKAVETVIASEKKIRRLEMGSRRSSMSDENDTTTPTTATTTVAAADDGDSAIDMRVEEKLGNLFDQIYHENVLDRPTGGGSHSPIPMERDNSRSSATGVSPSLRPQRPQSLIERPVSIAATRRSSMASPEEFLQQFVQAGLMSATNKTQHPPGTPPSPIPRPMPTSPRQRPSDTAAAKAALLGSLPLRRSSDSNTTMYNRPQQQNLPSVAQTFAGRRRAFSLQQQPMNKPRRRFSLRELNLNEAAAPTPQSNRLAHLHQPSPLQQQFVIPDSPPETPTMMTNNNDYPPSSSRLQKPSQYTRLTTANNNVFDRLSNKHTQASVAKRTSTPVPF